MVGAIAEESEMTKQVTDNVKNEDENQNNVSK